MRISGHDQSENKVNGVGSCMQGQPVSVTVAKLLTRDYNPPTYSAVTGELRSKANIWQPPMSYNKLAKLSGLRHDHVSRIFRGLRRPTFETLKRLSFPLQIDAYELARRLKC
jgi:transcriptional regulator with XRE-family HTH domain